MVVVLVVGHSPMMGVVVGMVAIVVGRAVWVVGWICTMGMGCTLFGLKGAAFLLCCAELVWGVVVVA